MAFILTRVAHSTITISVSSLHNGLSIINGDVHSEFFESCKDLVRGDESIAISINFVEYLPKATEECLTTSALK